VANTGRSCPPESGARSLPRESAISLSNPSRRRPTTKPRGCFVTVAGADSPEAIGGDYFDRAQEVALAGMKREAGSDLKAVLTAIGAELRRLHSDVLREPIEALIEAAKANRHGHRDATMILIAFRHGLRAAEVCDLRWDQVSFDGAVLHVRRSRTGLPERIPCSATNSGPCGACSATACRHPSSSSASAARRSPPRALPG
jgi:hypothetical protein